MSVRELRWPLTAAWKISPDLPMTPIDAIADGS